MVAPVQDSDGGARLILSSPPLRSLLALALLAEFYVVPEVLAAPYAAELGLGTAEIGLLMAVMPMGSVAGVFLFTRFVPPPLRLRLLGPLAITSSLPLVFSALFPGLVPSLVLWTLVGVLSAYQVTTNAEFVRIAPRDRRGQVLGLASSMLVAAQGASMIFGGVLADHVGVSRTLALAGVAGCPVGVLTAVGWHRARQDWNPRRFPRRALRRRPPAHNGRPCTEDAVPHQRDGGRIAVTEEPPAR
jgi:MFS family permease